MITTKISKEDFIQRMRDMNTASAYLIEIKRNVVDPLVGEFDGKVYNKRFINAFNEKCKDYKGYLCLCSAGQNHTTMDFYLEILHYPTYGTEGDRLYFSIICKQDKKYNYRIDADATLSCKDNAMYMANVEGNMEKRTEAVEHYDEYMEMAENLGAMIAKYNAIPYAFRDNVYHYGLTVF